MPSPFPQPNEEILTALRQRLNAADKDKDTCRDDLIRVRCVPSSCVLERPLQIAFVDFNLLLSNTPPPTQPRPCMAMSRF